MLLWWSLPIPRFAPSDWSSPFPVHQRPDITIQWVGVWVCGGDVHVIFRIHRTCKCLRVWAPCFFHSLATIVNYLYYTCKTSQSSCIHAGIDLLSSNYCNYNSMNHLHERINIGICTLIVLDRLIYVSIPYTHPEWKKLILGNYSLGESCSWKK